MEIRNWHTPPLKTNACSNSAWHYPSASFRGSEDFLCSVFAVAIVALVLTAGGLSAQETTASEVAALRPIGGAAEDEFGYSIAVSGDTMAVGARGSGGSGSVFIFERDEVGSMGAGARVVAADAADGDRFGQAVALEGDILAVGAPGDDDLNSSAAPGLTMLEASGSVYLFERDVGGPNQWGQVAKLVASNGDIFENFGFRLALSGDRLAVAAWSEDEAVGMTQGGGSVRSGIDSGFAYIFDRNPVDGLWLETIYIDSPRTPVTTAEAFFDNFAKTIAIDGDTLVVGASEEDANDADQGTVYVFERNSGGPNQWGEAARLRAGDGTTFDRFGISVAMSGDTIVVGATGDDDAGSGAGTAFVFDRQNGQWVDFHHLFNDTMTIREAHRIATSIEKKISGSFAFRVVVSTHLEPWQDHEKIHRYSS